jgi:predicted Kef-type K+ transport protein
MKNSVKFERRKKKRDNLHNSFVVVFFFTVMLANKTTGALPTHPTDVSILLYIILYSCSLVCGTFLPVVVVERKTNLKVDSRMHVWEGVLVSVTGSRAPEH